MRMTREPVVDYVASMARTSNSQLGSLRVRTGASVKLSDFDPADTLGWNKETAKVELERVKLELDQLQQRLFAEGTRSVLLVVQAMDAAGKDGTIRSIFSGLNPAGVNVVGFKVPGGRETQHDYLWRVHEHAPAKGFITVFNRSHYEDVLVVRVKGFAPRSVWSRRYDHINAFEQMLSDEGTTVVKCFLNVSKDKQKERFQERLDDPTKRWKFRTGDLEDRALWPKFQTAYRDALERTSTRAAPWYVVPADRNWVRNLAVARILLDTLRAMKPQFPDPEVGLDDIVID
jgi:PPK2 family polyphosphate:nucleotide phosphotransferase